MELLSGSQNGGQSPQNTTAKSKSPHDSSDDAGGCGHPAVALAFEEMRTPYASDNKFGYKNSKMCKTRLYHHQMIQSTEMLFANDVRFPSTILACVPWLFASCAVWDVLRLDPAFCVRCTYHVTLRTARFLCVLYSQVQKVHSPNLSKEKCMSEVVRIGVIIIFHLSKLWKAKFSILCDVIFLERLQGKLEIDQSWDWKG